MLGAVSASAWLGTHQATLWAALVGAASLAIFGWEPPGPEGSRKPFEEPGDLAAAFQALCSELKLRGTLYAHFDEEQVLRPAATTEEEPASPLKLGSDPLSRAMPALTPQVFNAYAAPTALVQPSFQGRSTLVFPVVRQGLPVGLALLASHQAEIGEPVVERVRASEPHLALLLENVVLSGRLSRSQSEKEALLALTQLAQGRRAPDQVFREAALHLRRLTGASHAAILLRSPGSGLTLSGLSAEGGSRVRDAFLAVDWAEREWPNLHTAFRDPLGSVLLNVAKAPLTPTEAAWAKQVVPEGHVLGVAFGPKDDREGLILLCWSEEAALRIHESRLASRLGDLMALMAATRRQSQSYQTLEAQEASAVQLAATQEALLSRLSLEARSAAYAVRHWREALREGTLQPGDVLSALDQQAEILSAWPGTAEPLEAGVASLPASLREVEVIAREACRRKGQVLTADPAPEAEVSLSGAALVQVLGVILDNASRFSPAGSAIRLWTVRTEAWVTIYVADQGVGIPAKVQARIGEPGFQVDPVRGGQGMALSHARAILDRAGGLLGFSSQEGAGTTFYVTLPRTGRPVLPGTTL